MMPLKGLSAHELNLICVIMHALAIDIGTTAVKVTRAAKGAQSALTFLTCWLIHAPAPLPCEQASVILLQPALPPAILSQSSHATNAYESLPDCNFKQQNVATPPSFVAHPCTRGGMCLVSNPVYQVQLILNAIVHAGAPPPPHPSSNLHYFCNCSWPARCRALAPLPPHRPVRPNARLCALAQVR
jgi:hypothetical protein